MVFIVGKGTHSAGGVQKLKPAIEELAREQRLTCIPNKPTAGATSATLLVRQCSRHVPPWLTTPTLAGMGSMGAGNPQPTTTVCPSHHHPSVWAGASRHGCLSTLVALCVQAACM